MVVVEGGCPSPCKKGGGIVPGNCPGMCPENMFRENVWIPLGHGTVI